MCTKPSTGRTESRRRVCRHPARTFCSPHGPQTVMDGSEIHPLALDTVPRAPSLSLIWTQFGCAQMGPLAQSSYRETRWSPLALPSCLSGVWPTSQGRPSQVAPRQQCCLSINEAVNDTHQWFVMFSLMHMHFPASFSELMSPPPAEGAQIPSV